MSVKTYDLKERIPIFVIAIIHFSRRLPQDATNKILINQIIRAVTSVGANYEEADGARSKKEFISTIGIVKKEAKEVKYWLKIIRLSNDKKFEDEIVKLEIESEELVKIFAKIIINSSNS